MKDLLEISCRLDVHKDKIIACILTGPLGKPTHSEIREFTTLIPDMIALRDWIVFQNCHHVAMESTGIYWMPIYEILEDAFSGDITLLVVNARHIKNFPGKKQICGTLNGFLLCFVRDYLMESSVSVCPLLFLIFLMLLAETSFVI